MQKTKSISHPPVYADTGQYWEQLKKFLNTHHADQQILLVDDHTKTECLPLVTRQVPALKDAPVIQIAPGDQHKNLSTCQHIWEALLDLQATRSSLLICLGGGMVTDIGGFTAATFKRGIGFIHLPTTLLGQIDAAIGGKTGINFNGFKNQIGCFQQPEAVFCFSDFFQTLSQRQLKSGFAEMIKHALIGDPELFEELQQTVRQDTDLLQVAWERFLEPAITIKQAIVAKDPYEKNQRKILNFGHTLGHALESASLETDAPLLHGEAIALGMIMETFVSHQEAGLSKNKMSQITNYLHQLYPIALPQITANDLKPMLQQDKKRSASNLFCTLLNDIGQPVCDVALSYKSIEQSFSFFASLEKALP